MDKDTTSTYLIKPAVMAGLAAAGAAVWRPGCMIMVQNSTDVPLPLVVAGVTFAAAEISALINQYLFPHIPQISVLSAPLHTGLAVGIQTATIAALENYISPGLVGDLGIAELVGFAAMSEIGSTYIVNEWIEPMRLGWSQN